MPSVGRVCLWIAIGLTLFNFMVVTRMRGDSRAVEPREDGASLPKSKAGGKAKSKQQKPFGSSVGVDSLDVDDGREDGERPELDMRFHSKGGDTSSMLQDPSLTRARLLKEGAGRMSQQLYASLASVRSSNGAMQRASNTATAAASERARAAMLRLQSREGGGGGGGGGVPTGRKNQKALECSKSGDVHVVYSSNSDEWGAMLASAYSALRNTYNPNRLLFHLIIPHTNDADELCSMIRTYAQAYPDVVCPVDLALPREFNKVRQCATTLDSFQEGAGRTACMCGLHFHILHFDPAQYPMMEHIRRSRQDRKDLLSSMNFARNFIDDLLLPWGVERIIYMDVDTIVQSDLRTLWAVKFKAGHFYGPAHTCNQPWSFWFNFKSWVIYNSLLKEDGCAVNAGVYMLDVREYAAHKIQYHIAELISIHEKRLQNNMKGIWKRGVHQPSFVLALYNYTQRMDQRWNVGQLGWDDHLSLDDVAKGYILHWNGEKKPWKSDGLYKQFWAPYALPLPAPRNALLLGNCLVTGGGGE